MEITRNQSILSLAPPSLNTTLGGQSLFALRAFLGKNEFERSPTECVASRNRAGVMLGYSALKLIRMARVIRAIRAAKDVNPESQESILKVFRRSFDPSTSSGQA